MTIQSIPKVILLADTSRESGRRLVQGIMKYVRLHGPWSFNRKPMFSQYQEDTGNLLSSKELKLLSQLKKWGADVIIANNVNHEKQFDAISNMGLPIVFMGSYSPQKSIPRCLRVRSDSEAIGKLAAEHLLDRGHKNFAYCGFNQISWSKDRGKGFDRRVAKAGFETNFYEQPKARTNRLWEKEQQIMANWLNSLPKPVGLMTCNDDRAQQVVEACKTADLHVPEQVAIIGVDNDEFVCDLSDMPLSSIPLDNQKAGYEAARQIHKMIADNRPLDKEIIVKPAHVIARHSTDILAIDDHDVAMALRYIRKHNNELIQVSDVLDVVAVGRRTLEQRFNAIVGRSIFAEITRCRINRISQVIVETNQAISQIAFEFGYSSESHISRYFKRAEGMTPLEYRKLYGQH